MGLIFLIAMALGKDCDELLREQEPFIQAQAKRFVIRSPHLARRMAMDADDVAQELLVSLWQGSDKLDLENERAVGFIRNRLTWRTTDIMRRAMVKPDLVSELDSATATSKETKETETLDELRVVLERASRLLSAQNFKYFYLYANGIELSEIAAVYKVQPHSVYHSIQASIKRLELTQRDPNL